MTRLGLLKLVLCSFSVVAMAAFQGSGSRSEQVERGRYLVEEVGQCGECHTPRDARGELLRSRWLTGAPVWFQPIQPVSNWAYAAPPIAGLGSLTRDQALQVLEKGLGPQGNPVRQPMHRYHMAPADAEAIVAYLQSLR